MNYPGPRSSTQFGPPSCDALIVGGGPAGLAAGIALRRRGLDVVLADALIPPIDKACGEGLMPDSRRELGRLGIDLDNGREFSGIHFANRNGPREDLAVAEFSHGKGTGLRRVDLHRSLIQAAEELGVRLQWGSRVNLTGVAEASINGQLYRYRYLIGADGEASRVRRWAGLESGRLRSHRFGFRRHYRVQPWSDHVEVHWSERGQAYVTPVGEDEVCVAAITRRRGLNFDRILEAIPYLREKLRGRAATGRDRGAVTATRKLRRVTRGNVALIGDASGSADAVTGEGLASAFRQALLLGEALGRDAIQDYEAGHGAILRLPQVIAAVMLAMDRWPMLRDRIIGALAADQALFSRLLAVHIGEEHLIHFAATQGARLGLLLLAPAHNDTGFEHIPFHTQAE